MQIDTKTYGNTCVLQRRNWERKAPAELLFLLLLPGVGFGPLCLGLYMRKQPLSLFSLFIKRRQRVPDGMCYRAFPSSVEFISKMQNCEDSFSHPPRVTGLVSRQWHVIHFLACCRRSKISSELHFTVEAFFFFYCVI